METEIPFRSVLIVGFAILFPIALYHRLRAHLAAPEKLDRRAEGPFILFTLRPVAVVSIGSLFAYLINPTWMAWSSVPLPVWIRWVGVGLGVMAGILLVVVFRTLGTNLT